MTCVVYLPVKTVCKPAPVNFENDPLAIFERLPMVGGEAAIRWVEAYPHLT